MKVIKFLKDINNRVNIKFLGVMSFIFGIIIYSGEESTLLSSAILTIILFILLILASWVQNHQIENELKSNDKRYADDPDWDKYKKLKSKFNGK